MADHRHNRIAELFAAARRLDPAERESFLDESCGDDVDLRREISSLLSAEDESAAALPTSGVESSLRDLAGKRSPTVGAELPDSIGAYRLVRQIGIGGMGVVYEAQQDNPRRRVALKIISAGSTSASMLRRFEHETEVLGRLHHPGIAQIYEAGTFDTGRGAQPYFAMEFIDGPDINSYARLHNLTTHQRLELVAKICDAVQHAHQQGVIHRDLKPGNILVESNGQPRILDFGIARATGGDIRTTTLRTDIGKLIGTVPYMSPEQAAGNPDDLDTRSDVYALGVLTYELLAGRLPYALDKKMVHEAVRVIIEQTPAPLSTVDRTLRGDIETIVNKALEKDKTRRYQSASALQADIERYLTDQPIAARPPSAWYQLKKFAARNKPLVAAAAVVVLALVAATIVSAGYAVRAESQRRLAVAAQASEVEERQRADEARDRAIAAQQAEAEARQRADAARDRADEEREQAVLAREAEAKQRELAERRFDDVRALANTFLFEIDRMLERVSGAVEVRRKLVTTAITYLDALAEESGDEPDPMLLKEIADGYVSVGDILGDPRRPNLGDTSAALEAYDKSLAVINRTLERYPDNQGMRLRYAGILTKKANIQTYLGQVDEALALLDEAKEAGEAMVRDYPDEPFAHGGLMGTLGLIGDLLKQQGRPGQALAAYEEARLIGADLAAAHPDNPRFVRSYTVAASDSAGAMMLLGRHEEAVELLEDIRDARMKILDQRPDDFRAQRDVGVTLSRLGNGQFALDRYDDALATYTAAGDIFQKIADQDPDDVRAQHDVTVMYEKLGNVYDTLGRHEDALAEYERCLESRMGHAAMDPENLYFQASVATALERVGDMHRRLNRPAAAIDHYHRAIEVVESVIRSDPTHALAQTIRVHSNHRTALAHLTLSEATPEPHLAQAIAALEAAQRGRDDASAHEVRLMTPLDSLDDELDEARARLAAEAEAS